MTPKLVRLLVTLSFGMACLTVFDRPVAAHAVLVESTPVKDSTIPGPDIDVKLRFNLRVDRARSRLTLTLPDGQTIPLKVAEANAPDTLVARATGLARGAYQLHWQVLAVDGHITRGDIPFSVSSS